jgi:LemA protein
VCIELQALRFTSELISVAIAKGWKNMAGFLTGLGVVFLVVLFLLFYVVSLYNGLVTLRNRFQNAYAQIDVQLKRRYDLIPNLVETAKGYMKHERETLDAVIRARNTAMAAGKQAAENPGDPKAIQNLSTAEVALAGSLNRFIGLSEAYPDLKANQNMLALQEELTSTENKISFARQAFNDAVTAYNTATELFPNNIVAGMGNFQRAALWELTEPEQKEPVKVSF